MGSNLALTAHSVVLITLDLWPLVTESMPDGKDPACGVNVCGLSSLYHLIGQTL